ncbi:hypothetical protein BCR33DRAFT_716836 [Rhizoclosmatium globosum]|uniref:Zn(2)-C6 fungal-type domain-containing protein n=1 Tax=Rhizoclosmatium globosum TaxID=329046 RepID=A0A1Y2CCY8_9FUNG|nr:hypothetical protein BCR33DRAFT_716836 [Rhizoclosmatium globosum]|eukprot:ORY44921.1 hypothetical protein BCR33DRAFT_716836 [Rhizoclosmatium globosum]
MSPHSNSCYTCRKRKKKCITRLAPDLAFLPCERCARLDIQCVYDQKTQEDLRLFGPKANQSEIHFQMSLDQNQEQDQEKVLSGTTWPQYPVSQVPALVSQTLSSAPIARTLEQYIQVIEAPLVNYDTDAMEMEDPDLMATLDDFQIVAKETIKHPCVLSYDADKLLNKFFSLPAVLRLTLCVVSFYMSGLKDISVSYYLRARKALIRAAESEQGPTFELVQSYYFLSLFSNMKGQPVISRQFLTGCLDLIVTLRLDIDPDDSPWLHHLNLTAREKEERRRLFWANYWSLVRAQACSPDPITIELSCYRMKGPTMIYDPHAIFAPALVRHWDCRVYALIGQIKRHYATPPAITEELLTSKSISTLQNALFHLRSCIPDEHFLASQFPMHLTREEEDRFLAQTFTAQESLFVSTMGFYSAVSILHRPILFLTCLTSCRPQYISSANQSIIVNSVVQCIEAAHRITSVGFFLASIEETTNNGKWDPRIPQQFYRICSHQEFFSIFEAAVVYWFVICRMQPVWYSFFEIDAAILLERVQKIKTTLRLVADYGVTSLEPLAVCVEAMVKEIEDIIDGRGLVTTFEQLELGLEVKPIGDTTDMAASAPVQDLWGFMGLLGMQVGRGVSWKGRSEESWRLFWKLSN